MEGRFIRIMDESKFVVLSNRLERLEHSNRRLRVMAWTAAIGLLVFMVIGFAPKPARTQEGAQDSILAKEIGIVDSKGEVRIALGIDEETGPIITIVDKKGEPAITMGLEDKSGSSAVHLCQSGSQAAAGMFVAGDGTSGMVLDDKGGVSRAVVGVNSDGTTVMSVNSKDEKASATLAVIDDSIPRLILSDAEGNEKVIEAK